MKKHVIVCGMPERLQEFMEPFKANAGGPHERDVVPLLFLWDGPVSDAQMLVSQHRALRDCPIALPRFCP